MDYIVEFCIVIFFLHIVMPSLYHDVLMLVDTYAGVYSMAVWNISVTFLR